MRRNLLMHPPPARTAMWVGGLLGGSRLLTPLVGSKEAITS